MQQLKTILLVERENVATRFILEWLTKNPSGLSWLKAVGWPLVYLLPLSELEERRNEVIEQGRQGFTSDVLQTIAHTYVAERGSQTPMLIIDPPTEQKDYTLLNLDSVLGSISNAVISRYEREWFYQISVLDTTHIRQWSGLYLTYTEKATEFQTLLKGLDLEVPNVSPNVTVFALVRPGEEAPEMPFGYTAFTTPGDIYDSRRYLAELSLTETFMVVDGDNQILAFPRVPEKLDKTYVYHAENPYNGLIYGHGGVKLFRRRDVLSVNRQMMEETNDFLLAVSKQGNGLTVLPQLVSKHSYQEGKVAGITAYREGYKLRLAADAGDEEANERLTVWCSPKSYARENAYMAFAASNGVRAAREGKELINDWKYLNGIFDDTGHIFDPESD